jgi:hypothetical protein
MSSSRVGEDEGDGDRGGLIVSIEDTEDMMVEGGKKPRSSGEVGAAFQT